VASSVHYAQHSLFAISLSVAYLTYPMTYTIQLKLAGDFIFGFDNLKIFVLQQSNFKSEVILKHIETTNFGLKLNYSAKTEQLMSVSL